MRNCFRIILVCFFVWILTECPPTMAQNKTQVELLGAKSIKSDKRIMNGARRLIGNVRFKQDSTIMECDSAYFYTEKNMFDAFGHVHLYKKGDDKINIKSDFLRHDGDQKMAHFRHHVVMRDSQVVLTTDSLDYDTRHDIGFYQYKAQIVDSATTLNSQKGYYYHLKNEVYFWQDVVVKHNKGEYQMYTDTIRYGTVSKIIHFFGPTEFYNDTNYMYAEFGWYNTITEKSMFIKKAFYSNPKQTITGDSLSYDRANKMGTGYSNVVATDTSQHIVIKGNYVEMHKEPEKFFVTDKALLISIMDGDSMFLHADTILSVNDSTGQYRTFKAFHHVKVFKSDIQLKTDSLFFSLADSIARFYGSPVLWAQKSQVTSEYIEAFVVNEKLDHFILYNTGLIIQQQDTAHYNQIKGAKMIGYFKDNELYKVDVFKKSETIYFPLDGDEIIGLNKGESTNMTIMIKDRQVKRVVYHVSPKSDMFPLEGLSDRDMKLQGFIWLDQCRPKKRDDVFLWQNAEQKSSEKEKFPSKTENIKPENQGKPDKGFKPEHSEKDGQRMKPPVN
jgi:hypothetical protein